MMLSRWPNQGQLNRRRPCWRITSLSHPINIHFFTHFYSFTLRINCFAFQSGRVETEPDISRFVECRSSCVVDVLFKESFIWCYMVTSVAQIQYTSVMVLKNGISSSSEHSLNAFGKVRVNCTIEWERFVCEILRSYAFATRMLISDKIISCLHSVVCKDVF